MTDIGKPAHFSVDRWLDCVEDYICSDEVELALWLLDHPPSFYKQHPPERAIEIRDSLHRQLFTPVQYKGIYKGLELTPAMIEASWNMRNQLVELEVKTATEKGLIPHLCELAPGAKLIPAGLRLKGYEFTYESLSLDDNDMNEMPEGANPFTIFICHELLEHLHAPVEIYQNYLKFNRKADVIMISTPLYTHYSVAREWRSAALGHLKTYGPEEMHRVLAGMFMGYTWELFTDDTIVAIGRKS